MEIKRPYLLFLGEAQDALAAKTSIGVAQWRPEWCIGQVRLPDCKADAKMPDMTPKEAAAKGAKTMIIGTVNRGGVFSPAWMSVMRDALDAGLDLASGLHQRLIDIPEIAAKAKTLGRQLFDVRHPTENFPIANGRKRQGKRLLTVGTDCSIGKMYTTLALHREMEKRGLKSTFRATGQTGILIGGSGTSVDAVVSDFVAGCVETMTPANDKDHWDLIEGQASLFHASYAGVTMSLIHGAQPDALVMCHEPGRPHMRGLPEYRLPDLRKCIDVTVAHARLTNAKAKCVGVSLNTSRMSAKAADAAIKRTEDRVGLVCVDPSRTGVGRIVDRLVKIK